MDNIDKEVLAIAEILDNKKASDIIILKVDDLTILADYFIVASGGSSTLVQTLTDEVLLKMRENYGMVPARIEGESGGRWVVIDYGGILVHIFHRDEREFYQLERLWKVDGNYLEFSKQKLQQTD